MPSSSLLNPRRRWRTLTLLVSTVFVVAAAWSASAQANQKWCVRRAWDVARQQYWFQLININSGKCLDQEFNANGARVKQFSCTSNFNQRWALYHVNQLQNLDGNKCLDIAGANPDRGAKLVVWDCHWSANWNQTWDFLP